MMMPAFRSRNCGSTAWVTRMVPKALVSKSDWAMSIGVPSRAFSQPIPALLTRTSIGPAAAMACCTLSSLVTSSGRTVRLSEAGRRSRRGERMVAMTFQPRSRKYFSVSRPKPEEQPVMSTVFMVCPLPVAQLAALIWIVVSGRTITVHPDSISERPMIDPLAEIVSLLQPSLPFSKAASGSGHWRVESAGDGSPFFAVILEGSALLSINDQPDVALKENDFVLIPAAYRFSMSSSETGEEDGADPSRVTKLGDETRHGDPDGSPNMRVLIGRLAFGSPDTTLVFALLPCLLLVRGQARLTMLVQMIRNEAQAMRPAKDIVLERLLKLLLIEALRSDAAGLETPGLLRGLADRHLGPAIRRMHEAPERAWTVEDLASTAMLSRSVFFD